MKLIDKILNEQNIYNSIYSLESYVFEKGLLDTVKQVDLCDENGVVNYTFDNDLCLYYALSDKHNVKLMETVIFTCQHRMRYIFEDRNNLFDIKVFFRLKNYDSETQRLKFRPLHTARLIDLICMVAILNCLMFDDDLENGERKLSDLSKLLPHNFYGNIPCTDVQYLFHKWQNKYKEYTKEVIEHSRKYQQDHSFLTEVCLDIKNFFPSVSPTMLYHYIIDKLSVAYENYLDELKMVVVKLLYFNIEKENVEPWLDDYYNGADLNGSDQYMNCGIPQGLPQSYFFGNLCMLEIKRILMRKDVFQGDAYFYVDDSVIYIQSKLEDETFKKKIGYLNNLLEQRLYSAEPVDSLNTLIGERYLKFQGLLDYKIKFHEEDKSVFSHIDDVDNFYGIISSIMKEGYDFKNVAYNLDEIDDQVSLKKLESLVDVIENEIKDIKHIKKGEIKSEDGSDTDASRLKLLKRLKKYFLYRIRLLKIREGGGPNESMYEDFQKRFLDRVNDAEAFFDQSDEDIFQTEYRLLVQKQSKKKADELKDNIIKFEIDFIENCNVKTDSKKSYLFYAKDVQAAYKMKSLKRDIYASLVQWAHENFCGLKCLNSAKQMEKIRDFLNNNKEGSIYGMQENGYEGKSFTKFVLKSSSEYQRRILNVYCSEIIGIEPSDALSFTKTNARRINYVELRILAYLRNQYFELEQFEEFVEHLQDKEISNQMGIDMGILEVLNLFIRNVKRSEWVDSLIVTHRLAKGLWYNGSKFLNSYTLHNEEHAVTLIRKSLEITNRIDYFALRDVDFYILFLACYLHDISMVIHPDLGRLSSDNGKNILLISSIMSEMKNEVEEFAKIDVKDKKNSRYKNAGRFIVKVFNEVYGHFEALVRDNHANDSARFIVERTDTLLNYLEPTLLSFVAKVSESHGYNVLDVYGLKSHAKDDTVSIKYLMILIRLADLLDVANDRVNYHLLKQNLQFLSPVSRFHWISHLVTDNIEVQTDYTTEKPATSKDKLITETINLNLHLNFKQMTVAANPNRCKGCQMEKDKDRLTIIIKGYGEDSYECSEKKCPMLCNWMMRKHNWLVNELVALNDYLFAVNDTLFKTKIKLNIIYKDDMKLDADLFDSVQEYLGE